MAPEHRSRRHEQKMIARECLYDGLVGGAEQYVHCTTASTDVDGFLGSVLIDALCHRVNWNCYKLALDKERRGLQLREMRGYNNVKKDI
jgi:hypothetical protein